MTRRKHSVVCALLALAACGGSSSSDSPGGGSGGGSNAPHNAACTYFGGKTGGVGNDRAQGVCLIPGSENVVICGNTTSTDFASVYPGVPGWRKSIVGASDAYVAILSKDLHSILAWTYLGGAGEDRAYGVQVDVNGDVWVVGFTGSVDFPAVGGGHPHTGPAHSWDAFVARFTPNLGVCEFSRCLGGTDDESPRAAFAVASTGEVYLSGMTASTDFPAQASAGNTLFDATANGGWDAWVAKLDPTGELAWATYLGGADEESAWSGLRLAPDESAVYVAGFTRSDEGSDGFPATNAFDVTYNGDEGPLETSLGDGFVAKLSPTGALLACTYLGGTQNECISPNEGLFVAPNGDVLVIGATRSPETGHAPFPVTANALDGTHNGPTGGTEGSDVFVAVLDPALANVTYCTYLGGVDHDDGAGIALDAQGRIVFTGDTSSLDFPVSANAYRAKYQGAIDAIVCALSYDSVGSTLVYSSYFGGGSVVGGGFEGDRGRGLVVRPSDGKIVFSGDTDVTDFPTTGFALVPDFIGGVSDAFAALHSID
ncbi:MAG: hypothetical protein IT453_12645 [Planctomycetes bacterium]|nr:hypothetical protein [Planctomycetota bacterium]